MDFYADNAFAINSYNGAPFPFSVEFNLANDVFQTRMFPLQLSSITDILERFSNECVAIYEFSPCEKDDPDTIFSLHEIFERQKITVEVFNYYVAYLAKDDIPKLFTGGLSHHDCRMFDWNGKSDNSILEKFRWYNDYGSPDRLELAQRDFANSTFHLGNERDCFLSIETIRRELCEKVFERHLQCLIAHNAQQRSNEIKLSEVPVEILQQMYYPESAVTILQQNISFEDDKLTVPYSNELFRIPAMKYRKTGEISYNLRSCDWGLEVNQ